MSSSDKTASTRAASTSSPSTKETAFTSSSAEVRAEPAEALGLDPGVLAEFCATHGPVAFVDLETTGLSDDPDAEILEIGVVGVEPGDATVRVASSLARPRGPLPRAVARLTGLSDADVASAPRFNEVAPLFRELLEGRTLIAHNADFERAFLTRQLGEAFSEATYLDTLDLLAVTHPDAPDLRLESFTRLLFDTEEEHRALADALDTARVVSAAGTGARRGDARFVTARNALERFDPESPWLALLAKEPAAGGTAARAPYIEVGETDEEPVPFDVDAIAAVLSDEARGRRHFPGYRVRETQLELARRVANNLDAEEILLLQGGTGVGKSLAYLAAAIPFAVMRELGGEHRPVVISTRTKLLQDQLLDKDIGSAARFLGYPELRALSIKGRANYVCERRLSTVLSEGSSARIFPEDRQAHAVLQAAARTRRDGEIGSVPAALLRRFPALRDLTRRSVATRSEQCTREQCASERNCPFGRKRAALAKAHLLVANHDLLLRWPPDYPSFEHVIADEVHEIADVADEVYALTVSAEVVDERFEELFGRPPVRGARRGTSGVLPARVARIFEADAKAWRRELRAELRALGRILGERASEFGELEWVPAVAYALPEAAPAAVRCAERLEHIASAVEGELRVDEEEPPIERLLAEVREAGAALRMAFDPERQDAVAHFERLGSPHDGWRLVLRRVSPADPFHEEFLGRVHSFAGVSASLFVGGSALASLGDLEVEERAGERLTRGSLDSPFPYAEHMRALALRGPDSLVEETADVLEELALLLGGRTLGLFTSLRRMNQVAEELAPRLRGEGIDVLLPRRASDDPAALLTRFQKGAAVLLGARKFWQGLDIPGEALQAVVIEKLPFDVPSELRKRREMQLKRRGENAFERMTLGRMLLHLKQMTGRLIRTEDDRGIAVLVEGRTDKRYFGKLDDGLPPGVSWQVGTRADLPELLRQVGIATAPARRSEST